MEEGCEGTRGMKNGRKKLFYLSSLMGLVLVAI
jgi:hypothetical protein